MSFSARIDIADKATPLLNETERRIRPATIAKIAGREGQNFTRKHFIDLNRTRPNQLGGKRTNFYTQAARGTTFASDAHGADISVNQVGIRQRLEGGVIMPKNGKYLTIPARAEAHGRRAREFSNLKVMFGKGGVPVALVEADSTRVKDRKEQGGGVMYWLVRRVVQQPDPSVMPNLGRMKDQIIAKIAQFIRRRETAAAGGEA